MAWSAHRTFLRGDDVPSRAREFAIDALTSWLGSDAATATGDCALIVSELVTNSLRAGARAVHLEVRVDAADAIGRIRIDVDDDADGWPLMQAPGPDVVSGRGLLLVDSLAAEWGVETALPGKRVWAAVDVAANVRGAAPLTLSAASPEAGIDSLR